MRTIRHPPRQCAAHLAFAHDLAPSFFLAEPFAVFTVMPAPQSTEQSFRDNLSQFRWARGNNDASASQQSAQQGSGSNPFSRFYNAIGNGYVPLRSNERSNEEEAYFALSRWERCVHIAPIRLQRFVLQAVVVFH